MEPFVEVDASDFIRVERKIGDDVEIPALQALIDEGCTLLRLVETIQGKRTGRWMIFEVRKPTTDEASQGMTCMVAWPPVATTNDCIILED